MFGIDRARRLISLVRLPGAALDSDLLEGVADGFKQCDKWLHAGSHRTIPFVSARPSRTIPATKNIEAVLLKSNTHPVQSGLGETNALKKLDWQVAA
jgi:hypothetical protein